MGHYRSKPTVIEAVQWNGAAFPIDGSVPVWVFEEARRGGIGRDGADLIVLAKATGRPVRAVPGDWIARDADGNVIVFKNAEFAARFEPVEIGALIPSDVKRD